MSNRINVSKTYKIFIGGKFLRTESGRYYKLEVKNKFIANICLSSKKDLRNAVVASRNAFDVWSRFSAYNRSQILYRIAEMMEGRKVQFIEEIILQGINSTTAKKEINTSIDRIIYYAGWADKINQVFGSINPIASSHFNFSLFEPMGVVGIVLPETPSILGLVSMLCPVILSGNTAVLISSESIPLSAVTFAEVLLNSDVPNGCVNILTGKKIELIPHLTKHMDVNAIFLNNDDKEFQKNIELDAASNLKRVILSSGIGWTGNVSENPYIVTNFMETKTTWHPIENISDSENMY